jgi:hypothetical protein
VTAALAAGRRTPARRPIWQLAAAAAAIVVAGLAWLAARPHRERPDFVAVPAPGRPHVAKSPVASVEPATLLTYRQALARSPAELNELLDRQATLPAAPHDQFAPIGVFTLWKTDVHSPLGEM